METPGAIRRDASAIAEQARALIEATSETADEQIRSARARLSEALEQGRNQYGRAKDRAVAGARAADDMVRTHPYETLGVAFGVGLLIGLLAMRRN